MQMLATVTTGLVALIHVYIVYLEMVLWTKPQGRKAFGLTPEFAEASKTLAANQGLYNGFLAAGLIVALIVGPAGYLLQVFCLVCVVVAGIFGAVTASRRILYIQALPAAVALVSVLFARTT